MKIRSISAIATALVLAATIGAQSAAAQARDLKSEVPFEFYAAGKLFPAGTYIVSQATPTTLRLRDARGNAVFISAGRESVPFSDRSWLVFHQYGSVSFLSGGYWSGYSTSLRVPADRAEQEIAKRVGPHKPATIAAR